MAVWSSSNIMLTQKGQELLSKVQAGDGQLTITRVVTGSGRVSDSSLFTQTAVSYMKQSMSVTKVTTMSTGSSLELQVTNTNLSSSYNINQIGVYAYHPDMGEILYMIAQCDEGTADIMPLPSVTPVTMNYIFYLIHSALTQLNITVDPAGLVSVATFNEHLEDFQELCDFVGYSDEPGGVDLSEIQSEIENLQSQIESLDSTTIESIGRLTAKDTDLQAQINTLSSVDMSEFQSQLNDKVDKVEGKGLSTNDYDDSAEEKVSKIGNTNLIPSDSRYVVQWIQDVYDSVFKSSADNTCLADRVAAEISHRESADTNLQSQIDTANTDIIETQESVHNLDIEVDLTKSNLNKVEARMGSWAGSGTLYDMVKADKTDIAALKAKDTNLQSQIDTKVTRKVAIVGSDTANSDGWYKVASGTMGQYQVMSLLFAVHRPDKSGKYSGILQLDLRGGTEAILTGDELKLGWLVRAGFDLSQVIVTIDGYNWALYYNLRSNMTFRTFFEVIQESGGTTNKAVYNLHTDSVVEATAPVATATSVDLGTVNTANKLTTARNINGIAFDGSKDINITANDIPSTSGNSLAYEVEMTKSNLNKVEARIGTWSNSKTLYDMIVDLTARIKTLESISGGGVPQAVLIDWDVNTNGATQGTVTKDANGLHASGDKSLRIANCWSCDVSAYDGITFTAYGSGQLRVEVGGIEGEYKTLGTKPTTYTIAFDDIGLTELSSIEINLQTQGAYDLTVSDIFGYTNI